MFKFVCWQSSTALIMALGMSSSAIAAPVLLSPPVQAASTPYTLAQLFPQPGTTDLSRVRIPLGTEIPVRYDKTDKIVVLPSETVPLTLTVDKNIRSARGTLLIPAGSQVKGKLKPAEAGSQFVAEELLLTSGKTLPIDATSEVITTTQEIKKGTNTGSILKGAAIGSAAAAVIALITGNKRISALEVLGGAGIGALGGVLLGKKKVDVVVINPDTDLNLTLNSSLALR